MPVAEQAVELFRPEPDRRAPPAAAPFPQHLVEGPALSAWSCIRASSATAALRRSTGRSRKASAQGASPCCRPKRKWTPGRFGPARAPGMMRRGRKASLYRNEVTEAAAPALLEAVAKFEAGALQPAPLASANGRAGCGP